MHGKKLSTHQLHVGRPIPFDTYDGEGKLLLRKGVVVNNQHQLDVLLERGLYADSGPEYPRSAETTDTDRVPGKSFGPVAKKISVFELTADIQRQLERLLTSAEQICVSGAPEGASFAAQVRLLAQRVQYAFKLDSDAMLATIQLQHEGRYGVRRQVHGAILMELLMGLAGANEAQRTIALSAALTMNIAMLDLQDILYQQKTPPDDSQREQVRSHPVRGVEMLRERGVEDANWLLFVQQHHETIDGKGTPNGLKGAQICKAAQLLSLADRYGAMATGRAYRPPALPNVVLKQIFLDKDTSVEASLANLLVKSVGVYPPGSVVELANGDIGVVVKRTQNASQPVVRCVMTHTKEVLEHPRKRLTSEPAYAVVRLLQASSLHFPLKPQLLWNEGVELVPT